jgi:hypothetical protein
VFIFFQKSFDIYFLNFEFRFRKNIKYSIFKDHICMIYSKIIDFFIFQFSFKFISIKFSKKYELKIENVLYILFFYIESRLFMQKIFFIFVYFHNSKKDFIEYYFNIKNKNSKIVVSVLCAGCA